MVYKVSPGDIFANHCGRGYMKPSHQVSYDIRLHLKVHTYTKFCEIFTLLLTGTTQLRTKLR